MSQKPFWQLIHEDRTKSSLSSTFRAAVPGGAIAVRGFGYRGTPPAVAHLIRMASLASYAGLLIAAAFVLERRDLR